MNRLDATDKSRFEFGLDKPLELKGDWAVTADWHVPLYDAKLVNEFLDASEGYGNLLIAGCRFQLEGRIVKLIATLFAALVVHFAKLITSAVTRLAS